MTGTAEDASGDTQDTRTGFERARALADAILYEGYLLYPYRKSSPKNRVRWQFGIVAPRDWAEREGPVPETVAGSVESWQQQTETLLEAVPGAENPSVHVRVRFLQWLSKTVERREPGGGFVPVESLDDDAGTPQLSFDEAMPHECDVVAALSDLLGDGITVPIGAPAEESVQWLGEAGRVVRRRLPVSALATLRAQRLDTPFAAYRLRLRIENTYWCRVIKAGLLRRETLRSGRWVTRRTRAARLSVDVSTVVHRARALTGVT
ncbi:hypothetical protein FHU38_001785 [Saccharomonospora amisosensis]|uniref:Uncharacterized protein n=1 Tax=Saccharomonospora amisosensis TaxID=1128677 RepID=A0A7X5ZQG1_9PSEU|nr:hypothetical protein [Saccharomonospora amisosensis]NIJ11441.1 hypothetical protein [Saccharomonospora amisosensis]